MSEKRMDQKNRWRSKLVSFRVSPEEWEMIQKEVRLCGYQTKQDFIIDCLLKHEVRAIGNPLMLMSFRKELRKIEMELAQSEGEKRLNEETIELVQIMLRILETFQKR